MEHDLRDISASIELCVRELSAAKEVNHAAGDSREASNGLIMIDQLFAVMKAIVDTNKPRQSTVSRGARGVICEARSQLIISTRCRSIRQRKTCCRRVLRESRIIVGLGRTATPQSQWSRRAEKMEVQIRWKSYYMRSWIQCL